jgi:hypothetical protein
MLSKVCGPSSKRTSHLMFLSKKLVLKKSSLYASVEVHQERESELE